LINTNDMCQVVIKVKRKEQKCRMEYTHDGTTSNIIAYLHLVHKIVDDSKLKAKIQRACQTKLLEIIKINVSYKKYQTIKK
ncbi:15154_t:CDS:1, partial [Cetraspora pellucida]